MSYIRWRTFINDPILYSFQRNIQRGFPSEKNLAGRVIDNNFLTQLKTTLLGMATNEQKEVIEDIFSNVNRI